MTGFIGFSVVHGIVKTGSLEKQVEKVGSDLQALEHKMEAKMENMEARMENMEARMENKMENMEANLIRVIQDSAQKGGKSTKT
jgi:hypothetical protein